MWCARSSIASRLSRPRLTRTRRWKSSATRPAKSLAKGGQHTNRRGAKNRSSGAGEPAFRNSGDKHSRHQDALAVPSDVEARPLSYRAYRDSITFRGICEQSTTDRRSRRANRGCESDGTGIREREQDIAVNRGCSGRWLIIAVTSAHAAGQNQTHLNQARAGHCSTRRRPCNTLIMDRR